MKRWIVLAGLAVMLAGRGWAQAPKIALTFDDLPETGDTPPGVTRLGLAQAIIKALQEVHAPVVYGFLNAQTLVDEPERTDVLQAWRDAGFLLGNHTYTHKDLNVTPVMSYERDIARNEDVLRAFMEGRDWHWFRYPYLSEGPTPAKRNAVRGYLEQKGYRIAQVTLDFHDYAWDDPYTRCATKHKGREIERLKRMYLDNAAEQIRVGRARARQAYGREIPYVMLLHLGVIESVMLPRLLELLKTEGFELVTLPEAESDAAYAMDPGVALKDGATLQEQVMVARGLKDGPFQPTPMKELDRICK
jgi:peptidoglycan/xylan/chitin deacetylase (PgdA/CDA1 family)